MAQAPKIIEAEGKAIRGIVHKAVAEPIGSKFSPQQREPSTDFGGESEVSSDGTKARVSDLQPSKTEKTY